MTADGRVRIPTLVSMTAPSWVGENTLIPEVDATLGEVTLLDGHEQPQEHHPLLKELARSSVVSLDSALRDKMVLDVAGKIDTAFFIGAGVNEGSVVLADFSQIAVARDLAPSVKPLNQDYADLDQQTIRVVAVYDTAPLTP